MSLFLSPLSVFLSLFSMRKKVTKKLTVCEHFPALPRDRLKSLNSLPPSHKASVGRHLLYAKIREADLVWFLDGSPAVTCSREMLNAGILLGPFWTKLE